MFRLLSLSLLAALACTYTACERHPASELEGEHGNAAEATHEKHVSTTHPEKGPMAPSEHVPANPAGAAPAAGTPAPQYFPGNH